MEQVPLHFQKWVKECIKDKFESTIEKGLDSNGDSNDIADRVIRSKEMRELIAGMKSVFANDCHSSRAYSIATNESRPQTSMSIASDLSTDDWNPMRLIRSDHFTRIANKINYDKPIHVRLAGYEALAKSELTNIGNSQSWDSLLKTLRDGIADESQPIFEASLQAHAMLLNGSQAQQEVFANLLNAFGTLYHSKRLQNMLPTFLSGINFKILLHEKLFRLMYLIIKHQEETLKSNRNTDKLLEEVTERFVSFLSSHSSATITDQTQTLTALNILSVLEPESDWSRKWAHSLTTLKILTAALARSPMLLQNMIYSVRTGAPESRPTLTAYVCDGPPEANISGDTVNTATYLNCLHILTQLCSKAAGRQLLTEFQSNEPFNLPDFMLSLLNSLNVLAVSDAPYSVYNSARSAMQNLLNSSSVLYDARFYKVALDPLLKAVPQAGRKIYPHTIDVMTQALDTEEGSLFMISMSGELPINYKKGSTIVCPATAALEYTSDLLQQPLSIMSVEHVVELFKLIGRLFEFYDVCQVVRYVLRDEFYPAIARLYNKMDKYSVDNEIKKQTLNSAIKTVLLKTVAMPFALQLLSHEEFVFEELLRGSVEPLKSSWNCNDVVAFVSSAALLPLGFQILEDLAAHFLSKVLTDVCRKLEDPRSFDDPWEDATTKEFLHILRILSLNIACFIAVCNFANRDENSSSEDSYPSNLSELLKHSVNPESPYHRLALMALNVFVRNLDANIVLDRRLNYQEVLLKLQEDSIFQTENDGKIEITCAIDEGSLLRHKVLLNSYLIASNSIENTDAPEEAKLFSKFPPAAEQLDVSKLRLEIPSSSELAKFLRETKPGLRDNGWVSDARKAHKTSSKEPIEHSVLVDLLNQMQKAVPTFELTSHFQWPETNDNDSGVLLPEEIRGLELALLYAEQNKLMRVTPLVEINLKIFLKEVHGFIEYKQAKKFEGFDWFAATIFIICEGNLERCRTFVVQLVQFPSIIYVWPTLGKSISKRNKFPFDIQIIYSHLLEGIIANELPSIKFALKDNCSVNWWMIINGIMSNSFWGILPWCEIVHLFAICILYPPDYTLYYSVSLLHYSQNQLMEDVTAKKMWPEHMNLIEYRCGEYFQLMDLLSKRYRNTTLPLLMEKES